MTAHVDLEIGLHSQDAENPSVEAIPRLHGLGSSPSHIHHLDAGQDQIRTYLHLLAPGRKHTGGSK